MVKKNNNYISWDNYFMGIAVLSAMRSKDPSTRVGACIVRDHKILSVGYNGFPNGISDDKFPWDSEADNLISKKDAYVCHAELNAILNSNFDLKGSTLYVTRFPCNECAKAIIQCGIKDIYYLQEKGNEREEIAKLMFHEVGITCYHFDNPMCVALITDDKEIEKLTSYLNSINSNTISEENKEESKEEKGDYIDYLLSRPTDKNDEITVGDIYLSQFCDIGNILKRKIYIILTYNNFTITLGEISEADFENYFYLKHSTDLPIRDISYISIDDFKNNIKNHTFFFLEKYSLSQEEMKSLENVFGPINKDIDKDSNFSYSVDKFLKELDSDEKDEKPDKEKYNYSICDIKVGDIVKVTIDSVTEDNVSYKYFIVVYISPDRRLFKFINYHYLKRGLRQAKGDKEKVYQFLKIYKSYDIDLATKIVQNKAEYIGPFRKDILEELLSSIHDKLEEEL